MATVRVVLNTAVRSFPFGTKAGPLRVTLRGADASEVFLEQDAGPFVFADVEVGSYTVLAARVDADGNVLGEVVSVPFVVNPTSIDIVVPISMTVTQE